MKDKDCGESCDPLSLEREPEPRLDGPDESARFTPLNNFFILHNTQQEVPSTPLTKSIKSKANFFHPFPKFSLFIYLF
jgi:hypothetical protein